MMILWWTLAALLTVALVFVFYPWLRRASGSTGGDQQQANVALYREHLAELEGQLQRGEIDAGQMVRLKDELERTLLLESGNEPIVRAEKTRGGWLIWALVAIIPLAAFGIYRQLGSSQDLAIVSLLEEATELRQPGDEPRLVAVRRDLLSRIGERLERDEDNFYYWVLTARLRNDEQDYPGALEAYRRAEPLSPQDVTLLEEYLQTAFLVAGGKPSEEMAGLVKRILELSPNNLPVLGLSGRLAMEGGDYQRAITDWRRVLAELPAEHETARMLAAEIERARAALLASGGQEVGPALQIQVNLSPELELKSDDLLFVIARLPGQAGPPLAVKRLPIESLPLQVDLDDSNLMLPGSSFANVEQVELVARISRSGTPQAQPGDLQGSVSATAVGSGAVTDILIDQVVE